MKELRERLLAARDRFIAMKVLATYSIDSGWIGMTQLGIDRMNWIINELDEGNEDVVEEAEYIIKKDNEFIAKAENAELGEEIRKVLNIK